MTAAMQTIARLRILYLHRVVFAEACDVFGMRAGIAAVGQQWKIGLCKVLMFLRPHGEILFFSDWN